MSQGGDIPISLMSFDSMIPYSTPIWLCVGFIVLMVIATVVMDVFLYNTDDEHKLDTRTKRIELWIGSNGMFGIMLQALFILLLMFIMYYVVMYGKIYFSKITDSLQEFHQQAGQALTQAEEVNKSTQQITKLGDVFMQLFRQYVQSNLSTLSSSLSA